MVSKCLKVFKLHRWNSAPTECKGSTIKPKGHNCIVSLVITINILVTKVFHLPLLADLLYWLGLESMEPSSAISFSADNKLCPAFSAAIKHSSMDFLISCIHCRLSLTFSSLDGIGDRQSSSKTRIRSTQASALLEQTINIVVIDPKRNIYTYILHIMPQSRVMRRIWVRRALLLLAYYNIWTLKYGSR